MTSKYQISIVTPSYHQAKFLESTIQSVIDQDYPNLQYIIIDGGSQDGSREIIENYSSQLFYWVSKKDRGQAAAINEGFKVATGDILGWLNSDDQYLSGTLNKVNQYFKDNPTVDCVFGDLQFIDSMGCPLYIRKVVPYNLKTAIFSETPFGQPASFWRRSVMERIGLLDEDLHYWMDYEYFIRMGVNNINFGMIPATLASFRIHYESKSTNLLHLKKEEANRVVKPRYVKLPFRKQELNDAYSWLMRWLYRSRIFFLRLALRGQLEMPFRVSRLLKSPR